MEVNRKDEILSESLIFAESTKMWTRDCFVEKLHKTTDNANTHIIGYSEAGRPINGFVFGEGAITVSLIAGAHADEPVGPNTLYRLVLALLNKPELLQKTFSEYRLLVIPHINPDGDAANASWINQWPDIEASMNGMVREQPGRDLEFGYPGMRPENRAAVNFWKQHGSVDLHMSLHGMAFSEGFLLLINDEWEERTRTWRESYSRYMKQAGLLPHDHDRQGEKGFNYMGPGFTSTPKGSAMHHHFMENGDPETAKKFHQSSMEYHAAQNVDVFSLVTELPLFLLPHSGNTGRPENHLAFKEARLRRKSDLFKRVALNPLPLEKAMSLQCYTIISAMKFISGK